MTHSYKARFRVSECIVFFSHAQWVALPGHAVLRCNKKKYLLVRMPDCFTNCTGSVEDHVIHIR